MSRDSQCSTQLLINVAIQSAHCDSERNLFKLSLVEDALKA